MATRPYDTKYDPLVPDVAPEVRIGRIHRPEVEGEPATAAVHVDGRHESAQASFGSTPLDLEEMGPRRGAEAVTDRSYVVDFETPASGKTARTLRASGESVEGKEGRDAKLAETAVQEGWGRWPVEPNGRWPLGGDEPLRDEVFADYVVGASEETEADDGLVTGTGLYARLLSEDEGVRYGGGAELRPEVVNLVPEADQDLHIVSGYGGATLTYTPVAVPAWGATDALRIQSAGGSSPAKYVKGIGVSASQTNGLPYTASIWAQNNGAYPIDVGFNHLGGFTINPGQSFRGSSVGYGNTVAGLLLVLYSDSAAHNIDITMWRPQINETHVMQEWVPVTRPPGALTLPTAPDVAAGTIAFWLRVPSGSGPLLSLGGDNWVGIASGRLYWYDGNTQLYATSTGGVGGTKPYVAGDVVCLMLTYDRATTARRIYAYVPGSGAEVTANQVGTGYELDWAGPFAFHPPASTIAIEAVDVFPYAAPLDDLRIWARRRNRPRNGPSGTIPANALYINGGPVFFGDDILTFS